MRLPQADKDILRSLAEQVLQIGSLPVQRRKADMWRRLYRWRHVPTDKTVDANLWMAPWDILVRWYGVTELLVDMCGRPGLLRAAIDRLVGAMNHRLDQLDAQNAMDVAESFAP